MAEIKIKYHYRIWNTQKNTRICILISIFKRHVDMILSVVQVQRKKTKQ